MRDEFGSISLKFPFDARSDSEGLVGDITEGVTVLVDSPLETFVSLSSASDCDGGCFGALERIGVFVATHVVSFP